MTRRADAGDPDRERSLDEWRELLASEGFRLETTVQLLASEGFRLETTVQVTPNLHVTEATPALRGGAAL